MYFISKEIELKDKNIMLVDYAQYTTIVTRDNGVLFIIKKMVRHWYLMNIEREIIY